MMIDDIYNSKILSAAAHISYIGHLNDADASSRQHSRVCGSVISIDVKVHDGIIIDFAQQVRACALGQAAASLTAQHVIGTNTCEIEALRYTMYAMLKDNGAPPTGKFAALACLQPVKDFNARHASTLLIFDALVDCIQQIKNAK